MDSSSSAQSDVASVVAGCQNLIEQLTKCVAETPRVQRFMLGACSELNREVDRCRTKVWKAQQAANYEKSQERKRKMRNNNQSASAANEQNS